MSTRQKIMAWVYFGGLAVGVIILYNHYPLLVIWMGLLLLVAVLVIKFFK
jgi:hypothetical protein